MSLAPLTVSLVQGNTRWHDAAGNRDYYGALVRSARGSDLVVLPETYLSGFSNDTVASLRKSIQPPNGSPFGAA